MQIQHILWREFIENIENDLNLKNNYWTCCCTMIMLCSETKMIGGITVSKWQIPYPQEVKVAGYIRTQFSLTAPISRPVPTRRSIRRNRLRKRQRSIPDSCAERSTRKMRCEWKRAKGIHRTYLAGVSGFGGADTENGACERALCAAQGDDWTGFCGRERETRDALYTPQRLGRRHTMGQA